MTRPELTSLDMEELILRWLATNPRATMTDMDARFPFGQRMAPDSDMALLPDVVRSLVRQGWVRETLRGRFYRYSITPAGGWATTFELADRLRPWWPGPIPAERLAGRINRMPPEQPRVAEGGR